MLHDCHVQARDLGELARTLDRANRLPVGTALAVGRLIERRLSEQERRQKRAARRFRELDSTKYERLVKELAVAPDSERAGREQSGSTGRGAASS